MNEIAIIYIMEYLQIFEDMIMKHLNINKWNCYRHHEIVVGNTSVWHVKDKAF